MLDRILTTRDDGAELLTRLAAIPLVVIMGVAIVSTKIPILLGHEFLIFSLLEFKRYGFWSMQHEARTDLCMVLGLIYLLVVGLFGKDGFEDALGRIARIEQAFGLSDLAALTASPPPKAA
jgi:hypothetical protein